MFHNSSGQSLADLTMAEAPSQTPPPRSVTSNALSDDQSQAVTDLLSYLSQNSYAYDSHVQLINILHQGFLAHVNSSDNEHRDPHSYGLLHELRQARDAMDTRFAVGEDLWIDWLADEVLLATSGTGEERVTVTELFQKAVQDEPASVKLWNAYAEWVNSNYRACYNLEGADQTGWTDEDKDLCKELFTHEMLVNVLQQGMRATQWRLDESHVLFDRYMTVVQQGSDPTHYMQLIDMYMQRLQVPHAASSSTAQSLFSLTSKYDPPNWEVVMQQANEVAMPARRQFALREKYELVLQRADEAGDKEALFNAFSAYLEWECANKNRMQHPEQLCCALFERALLRFPTYTEWWLDYIDFIIGSGSSSIQVLPIIERATRHCPWSGDLWGRRILRSAVENKPYSEIEHTKHRATNSGLLDVGGLEELVKVLQQWCSYLRRHAFDGTSTEDDQDTAEVGIVQAIEDIQRAGEDLYGKDFQGDPLHRLETIQIKFFTEARRANDAREIYRRLVPLHKNKAEFWYKYYHWELMLWGFERMSESHRIETQENGPHLATAVIQQALNQENLDWPERVVDLYLNHFQQHESGEKLQSALIEARMFKKRLEARRAQEAAEAAAPAQRSAAALSAFDAQQASVRREKRRAEEALVNGDNKRVRSDDIVPSGGGSAEDSATMSAQTKRSRENNTITLRNLPGDVSELDIKKFFRDVGKPVSINLLKDKDGSTSSATVEFESHEDVLAAKTRDGKQLNGNQVYIQSGSQNTLYVANYPPEFDETAIRKLFDSYGEIISVRFPSLKYNNRRRFCYVQFLNGEMAKAAEASMDEKMLDGQHRLLAKISNPDAKKKRSGAQAEGRELFVKNIERNASESDIKEFFSQYGNVVSINLLKLVNNKRTGAGFIVYSSADEANAALAADNKPFKDRILHVEISSSKAEGRAAPIERARKMDVIVRGAGSASPEPEGANGRRGSDVSLMSSGQAADEGFRTARERKIAIFNLPDTVNDARIRSTMEKYGPIMKIQLRRQDSGAIVEFAHVKDAFNVRQGVDVSNLGDGVKTGDVGDLLTKKTKKEQKTRDGNVPQGASIGMMARPAIPRPGQRGGRRGGLGSKRGGALSGSRSSAADDKGLGASPPTVPKSNADFRAMLESSRTQTESAKQA